MIRYETKGMLLVISGPAGAGKGTLAHRLLDRDPGFAFSVSATTRAPRAGECDGVDYHFISEARYDELLASDAFLEHASVHGHRYGTLRSEVEERIAGGRDVLLEIDVQGALNVKAQMPECVSVFILPPGWEELRQRLIGRGSETEESLALRLRNALGEVELLPRYDYCIINDDVETAAAELFTVVAAERLKTSRRLPVLTD